MPLAGTRSACINAATLALADAGIPMRDLVTSCSAGYLNSTALLGIYLASLKILIGYLTRAACLFLLFLSTFDIALHGLS